MFIISFCISLVFRYKDAGIKTQGLAPNITHSQKESPLKYITQAVRNVDVKGLN